MNKKILSLLLCSSLLMTFLSGCSSLGNSDGTGTDSSVTGSGFDGKTITVMSSQDWIEDAEMDLGAKFEEETGIHVDYNIIPAGQYQEALLSSLNSGEGPDIFMAQSGVALATTYRVQENAVDLSNESWMEGYSTFSAAQTSVDGTNYGMTYYDTTTDYYFIYNKKILEAAGVTTVPKTFEEFENMCQKILDFGVTPIYEPVADGWHQTMLWAESGQVFDKIEPGIIDKLNNNEVKFADNANMKKALEQINDLAQKGYFGETFLTDEFDKAEDHLAIGDYAMCFLKSGTIKSIISNENNSSGYTEDDFGIMLFPICDNQYLNIHPTGPAKFIYSGSPNVNAAKDYLAYIAKKDSIQYVIDKAADVENLPFEVGQVPEYSKTTLEFLESYDDEHSGIVIQDVVKYYNEQWGDISSNMSKMFAGEMTADEVLQAVDDGREQLAIAAGDTAW